MYATCNTMDSEYCHQVVIIWRIFSSVCAVLSAFCAALAYEILVCCDEKLAEPDKIQIKGTKS